MKNLFPENSLHYYKKGKSKMIKPLGIFRFQGVLSAYYTIPKINRELQPNRTACFALLYYTIPKINRELQLFIRCQGDKEGLNFDLKKNVFFLGTNFKKGV
mgnify:CR=1 FL=1